MKISIIIPAYNAAATLSETLNSLLAQTYPNWEAIVVNDGSSDRTRAIAQQFADQDTRIRITQQPQSGVCAARNRGIALARHEWLLFLDADDWIAPTHLECLLTAARQNRDLDAVYSHWTRVTPDGNAVMDQEFSFPPHQIFAALSQNCVLAIHCCLIKREMVVALGGFDVSLKTCEDWDLWQRIARTGARFGSIPAATAYYRIRPGSLSHESLQVFADSLRVITTGHSADPRVPHPSPVYAQGMPAAALPGVRLTTLCWYAGLLLGSGQNPLVLFESVQQDIAPDLDPDAIALSLFWSTFLPTGQTAAVWVDLWPAVQAGLVEFLNLLEQQSRADHLQRRVCQRLETLILDHAPMTAFQPKREKTVLCVALSRPNPVALRQKPSMPGVDPENSATNSENHSEKSQTVDIAEHFAHPQPEDRSPYPGITLGFTYGICLEITQPITDIPAPAGIERLHCRITAAEKFLGTVLLPVCDGAVSGEVLRDAIAARYPWEILGEFFQRTLYPSLRFRQEPSGVSVWRNHLCLAEALPSGANLQVETHHRIGWTVFLQELWNRPHWPESFFYYQQGWKRALRELQLNLQQRRWALPQGLALATPCRSVSDGWITVELTEALPQIQWAARSPAADHPTLNLIPTLGGIPLGIIPLTLPENRLQPQALRALIIRECATELVVAAVREGILGQPLTGEPLRQRLQKQRRAFPEFIGSTPWQAGSGEPGDRTLHLPRHPGAIGTSSNRRATLPAQTAPDLLQMVTSATPGTATPLIQRIEYLPEWVPPIAPPHSPTPPPPHPNAPTPHPTPPRLLFETLFATQSDPWHYTSPYEQIKYEQTLELLPQIPLCRVLELACAEGHFTVQLAPRVEQLLAADISQVALERAAQRCADWSNVQFQLFDLTQDEIPGQFDLILCSEVLYYVGGQAELQAFARRVAAALTPGGYFLHAHANLVVDEPDQPGYDWGHPFGAKGIGATFAQTRPLRLVQELHTPLYRIQLFYADPADVDREVRVAPPAPQVVCLPQPAPPPPYVAEDIRWQGGVPHPCQEECIVSDRLPILMYHRIHGRGSAATARYRVTPEHFEQQLRYLRDAGYYSISLETWRVAATRRQPLPGRPLLITFDDGYRDFLTEALPLLQQYGFSAMVFLVAEAIGRTNEWDEVYGESVPLLDWDDLRTLQQSGIELGAHATTHRPLTALSPTEITREGVRSRTLLQQALGRAPQAFAYPYGDTDPLVQHLIGACGFIYGLSCQPGLCRFQDSLLALPRIEITGEDDLRSFVQKLQG